MVSTDCIGVWRVFGRLVDVIDRGPAGTGASEDFVEFLCRGLYGIWEIYRKVLAETVDDKIKEILFLDLIVCLGLCYTTSKQTLPLTQCDRPVLALSPSRCLQKQADAVSQGDSALSARLSKTRRRSSKTIFEAVL